MTIAALYVETGGWYFNLPGVDPWDEALDARAYPGPHPVVAHPPCQRWGRFWNGGIARRGEALPPLVGARRIEAGLRIYGQQAGEKLLLGPTAERIGHQRQLQREILVGNGGNVM